MVLWNLREYVNWGTLGGRRDEDKPKWGLKGGVIVGDIPTCSSLDITSHKVKL